MDDESDPGLRDEGGEEVEYVQRPVRPADAFRREFFGERRETEDRRRTHAGDDRPYENGRKRPAQNQRNLRRHEQEGGADEQALHGNAATPKAVGCQPEPERRRAQRERHDEQAAHDLGAIQALDVGEPGGGP